MQLTPEQPWNQGYVLFVSTLLFATAVFHTLFCGKLRVLSHRLRPGSLVEKSTHYLSEVEVVFGFWALIFTLYLAITLGFTTAVSYINSVNYSEAVFVFAIMCLAATKPILELAQSLIQASSKIFPFPQPMAYYSAALIIGPLLGSFITEPAAMTVVALLLKDRYFGPQVSSRFQYATLGLLFVNISIGGTLTSFAAPPVLMVAGPWKWDTGFLLTHFGWKAALVIMISTMCTVFYFKNEFLKLCNSKTKTNLNYETKAPVWLKFSHCLFMLLVIMFHAHVKIVLAMFLIFLGWYEITKERQTPLQVKQSLLVGFFLAGLVTLGGLQAWWLQPLISQFSPHTLFLGATALTAVTDNAALTYLATLVKDISPAAQYAVVAGAVAGGGLTVIANAPNPAGYGILQDTFGEEGIKPLGLLLGALPFTVLAVLGFWIL